MILIQKNTVIAVGRLPRDAKFRTAGAKNSHFCSFGIAADEYTDETGNTRTRWLDIDAAFDLADIARTLKKGDRVLVAGKLNSRSYTTREGVTKEIQELKAEFVLPMPAARSVDDLAASFPGVVSTGDGVDVAFAAFDDNSGGELPF